MTEIETYDVVVVGGGAAGLSGAMALARSRRSVLVVDAGEPRNAPAEHLHNYLGREGAAPRELLAIGRAEVEAYGATVTPGRAMAARPWDRDGIGFVVTLEHGREVAARRVLLATGVRDELPDVPGVRERWGRDALHCPYCHGWEARDRAIAVLAGGPMATHMTRMWRQLSDDVVLVVDPDRSPMPTDDELEQLAARGVEVVERRVTGLVVEDDVLTGLRLDDEEVLSREIVVVQSIPTAAGALLDSLGIEPIEAEMGGHVMGTQIPSDEMGQTAVPGVWVAGNAAELRAQVIVSAASGLQVGAMVNADLIAEETQAAVAAARAALFEQPAWEERYAAQPAVWSGQVNAQLAAEAAGLLPGRALDVGSGEGADTLWLARHGWRVTGLDFSKTALDRAAQHADEAGMTDLVEWRHADIRDWHPDGETWDLVSSQFMHQPDGGMVEVTERLAAAVAPGGTLLVVGHHPDDLATGLRHSGHTVAGHPVAPMRSFMFVPEDLVPALDPEQWEILVADVRPRVAHHPHHDGPVTIHDSVLRARRRP